MKYLIFLSFIFLTLLNAYDKYDDNKTNVYFESEHFRVIAGIAYKDSSSIQAKADVYLDAAETTWKKEIVEFKFQQPKNSDKTKIDIYIGNKDAISKDDVETSIGSSYAGYATTYPSDDTPYFVINPKIDNNIVKVTIAHEFFHTVQYAYYDFLNISDDDSFAQQIWWLEATAVLMEDEVYDDINDYVNYLNIFFQSTYKKINCYDTWNQFNNQNDLREYSMVIFAKFLKENYGMKVVKDSFINFINDSDDFYEVLDSVLQKDYGTNIQEAIGEFSVWVANTSKYFEEGSSYPALVKYQNTDTYNIEKGGFKVISNLKKGWNMVSLPNFSIDKLDIPNMQVIWEYDNGNWKNNIPSSGYNQIENSNISKGYWVYVDEDSYIPYSYYDHAENNFDTLDTSWHLLGTDKNIDLSTLNSKIVWQYKDDKWYLYTNQYTNTGYTKLSSLLPYSSFWILK